MANEVGARCTYSDELADLICERLAAGESMVKILQTPGMPGYATVYKWLREHKYFQNIYIRAREDQADTFVDQITAIADFDLPLDDRGHVDVGRVMQMRLMVDARKWAAAKLRPKKYGDQKPDPIVSEEKKPTIIINGMQLPQPKEKK